MSIDENIEALNSLAELESKLIHLRFDIFREMKGLLVARDNEASCVWRACDPYTTSSAYGIEGDGQRTNCGRANKDGVDYVKEDRPGYERYLALHYTPQEFGGCRGCRFFVMCKGQCPGTAINGDWRNRTEHCAVWTQLFERFERELQQRGQHPISIDPHLIYLEEEMTRAWESGLNPSLNCKLDEMKAARLKCPEAFNAPKTNLTSSIRTLESSFFMRRLDFRLKDFVRQTWVSDKAREVWQPRIHRVVGCAREIEWKSVIEGLRRCSLDVVGPGELDEITERFAALDLIMMPLQKLAVSHHYTCAAQNPADGQPFNYWAVLGRKADVEAAKFAFEANDQNGLRALLGHPACCRDFYDEVWVRQGFVDTTWPMAYNTLSKKQLTQNIIELPEFSKCNILLRWLGPRMVLHLPCSFDCQPSMEMADALVEIGRRSGFREEMDWLSEMIGWPVEWTALHGIAEVKTPVARIATVTDATSEKYCVRYLGRSYPQEGAKGIGFPFGRQESK